jgi:hypothetical protein
MKKKFYVISMQVDVVHTMLPGESCCSPDVDGTMEVNHLYLKDPETGDVYDFSFWTDEGWCGSGYTTASWGCYDFSKCENERESTLFNYVYAKPDKTVYLDVDSDGALISGSANEEYGDDVVQVYDSNDKPIITVNYDCGDSYYPRGYSMYDDTYFRRIRGTGDVKRKVYIFTGPSGIGKSYLTSKLIGPDEADLFDTDEKVITEDTVITATYIVIGQKNPYSIEDVVSHIFDRENVDVVAVNMELL